MAARRRAPINQGDHRPITLQPKEHIMSIETQTPPPAMWAAGPPLTKNDWVWLLVYGILEIVVGLLAMGSAFIATLLSVVFLGILLLVAGGVQIVSGVATRGKGLWVHLLAGIVYAIAGFLVVQHPLATAVGLTLMMAAAFLFGGIIRIAMALADRMPGWGYVLANGIITAVLGLMLWRRWPEDSLWVIGLFVGIDIFISGVTWVMLALAARNLTKGAGAHA
jgi:uncharacterized membrane protein HdeD (DUF308 family)